MRRELVRRSCVGRTVVDESQFFTAVCVFICRQLQELADNSRGSAVALAVPEPNRPDPMQSERR